MKEDKMENIHLIFKFLCYSVLFCIWGVSCTLNVFTTNYFSIFYKQ